VIHRRDGQTFDDPTAGREPQLQLQALQLRSLIGQQVGAAVFTAPFDRHDEELHRLGDLLGQVVEPPVNELVGLGDARIGLADPLEVTAQGSWLGMERSSMPAARRGRTVLGHRMPLGGLFDGHGTSRLVPR